MFANDFDQICRGHSNNLADIVSPNLETAIASPQKNVQKTQSALKKRPAIPSFEEIEQMPDLGIQNKSSHRQQYKPLPTARKPRLLDTQFYVEHFDEQPCQTQETSLPANRKRPKLNHVVIDLLSS